MAQAFNLTAQLNLQAPGNVNQVMSQIRRQLKPIGVQVNIQNTRSIAQANSSLQQLNKNAQASTKSMNQMNRTLQESARRFSVITLATGSFLALANAFKKSVKEAVAFETELLKISQVTGKSVGQLSSLSKEVTRLSTSLGASSSSLLNVARTLTQAGFAAEDVRKSLNILAQTTLAATFDNIQDTTEGAIALLRQFSNEARAAGGDVKFLEQSLDAVNAVSKRFAVESADLITVIRRTGGVFSAAGGELNELLALFTSVRSTTRESAETIATGLRTIFTRIQRPESIEQLREFGIELQDAQGRFVGAFEAFRRLSVGLQSIDPKTTAFSQIVEDLGGFRQVGKVIPLIQQFTTAQDALNVAQGSAGSVARDALIAQQGLGNQISKTREQFDALIRKFVDSSAFRSLAEGGIKLAEAFIRIAESLEPLLPMLLTLAGLKLGRGLAPMLGSIAGFGGRGGGGRGPVSRFARGGVVPGSGNRDTVPALLTPGEFVIRKSSVSKLGADTLHAMNENRFNEGSRIREQMAAGRRSASTGVLTNKYGSTQVLGAIDKLDQEARAALNADLGTYGGAFLRPEARDQVVQGQVNVSEIQEGIRKSPKFAALKALASKSKSKGLAAQVNKKLEEEIKGIAAAANGPQAGFVLRAGSLESAAAEQLEDSILGGITQTVRQSTQLIGGKLGTNVGEITKILKTANIDNVVGNIFEATLLSAGVPYGNQDRDSSADFDFPSGLGGKAGLFGLEQIAAEQTDAKSSFTNSNIKSFIKKVKNVETKKSIQDIDDRLTDDFAAIKAALNTAIMQEGGMKIFGQGIKGTGKDQKDRNLAMTKARAGILNRNSGGSVPGSDTVPAMLTPGEFVMSKSASQSIGYGTLNRMNKHGVQGYAAGGIVGFQNYNTGTGPLGATGAGTVNFAGVNSVNEAMMRLSQTLADMGVSVDKQIPILKKFEEELKKGGKVSEALANTFKNTDINVKKTSDIIRKTNQERQKEQREIQRSQRIRKLEKVQGFAQRAQGALGGANQISGTLQSVVFLGAAITAVTAQFGDMEETTKKAVTQTATLFTTGIGIIGSLMGVITDVAMLMNTGFIGGIGKMIAAMSAQTAATMASAGADTVEAAATGLATGADTVEAAASGASTLADTVEATASVGSAVADTGEGVASVGAAIADAGESAASLAVTVALYALLAAILVVVAVMAVLAGASIYAGYKAKAMADEMGEAADKLKEKFAETGEGMGEIVAKLRSQSGLERDSRNNFVQAASVVPIVGTSLAGGDEEEQAASGIGAAIGLLLMGAVGAVVGSYIAVGKVQEARAKKEEELFDRASAILTKRLNLESELIKSLNNFKSTLDEIDQLEITDEEKTARRLEAESQLGQRGTSELANRQRNTLEFDRIRVMSMANERGASYGAKAQKISSLTNAELEQVLAKDGGRESLGLSPIEAELLESSLRSFNKNLEIAANRTLESRKTLAMAASQADPSKSFQELMSENGDYAKALRATTQAITQESKIREQNYRFEADRLQLQAQQADARGDTEEADLYRKRAQDLQKVANEEVESRRKTTQDLVDTQEEARNASKDRYDADQRLLAANIVLRQKMLEAAQATALFANQIKALENIGNNLDDIASLRDGGRTELRAKTLSEEEITPTTDLGRFEKEANAIISGISDTNARRQAEIARDQSLAFGEFLKAANDPNKGLANAQIKIDDGKGGGLGTEQIADNIGNRLGVDLDTLGPEIKEKIIQAVIDAGGKIDLEALDDIIDIASSGAQEYADLLKQASQAQQTYLDVYGKYLDAVQAQFDAELEYRENAFSKREGIFDSDLEARNLLAKSRDRDAVEIGPDRAAREARRQALAQANLDAAGVGVAAGDVGGLASARDQFEKELLDLDARIKATGTGTKEATKLATEQAEAQRKLASVNKELERISDQSERRQDIINEMERNIDTVQREIESREELIEAEKKAREQMYSVLEDFVVGGTEDRQRMAQAAMGVNYAISTGTLQNQDEEQRKATVAMLDKLSDVEITFDRATGQALTGRQVKERLVFNDAISMGFPPEVARQIAQATSKEQQLIDEVKQLNRDLVASNTDLYNELQELNGHIDKAVEAQAPSDNFLTAAEQQVKAAEIMMDAANTMAGSSGAPPVGTGTVLLPHTGGHVGNGVLYRAGGGSIFKPRGTDTVPAMLTPGEFVIRKSAVDKIGVGTLQALNNGDGAAVSGFAKGGVVYASNGIKVPYPQAEYDKKVKDAEQRAMDSFMADQRYNPDRKVRIAGAMGQDQMPGVLMSGLFGGMAEGVDELVFGGMLKRMSNTNGIGIGGAEERWLTPLDFYPMGLAVNAVDYFGAKERENKKNQRAKDREDFNARVLKSAMGENFKKYDPEGFKALLPIKQTENDPYWDSPEIKPVAAANKRQADQWNAAEAGREYIDYSDKSKFDFENFGKTGAGFGNLKQSAKPSGFQTQVGGAQDFSFGGPKKPENDDNMFDPAVIQANMEKQATAAQNLPYTMGKKPSPLATSLPSLDSLGLNIDPLSTDIAATRRQRQISNLKGSIARAGSGFSGEGALTKREQERIDRMKANLSKLEQQEQARSAATGGGPSPMVQGRQNVNSRRKARLAEQREGVSGGKKEKDIAELRKARGMRMRGRTADGQKYGSMAGSRLLNSMAYGSYGMGGMGGYGGGYGGGMLPFGYIPGSPYNSMLGRGGYNIPRFSPYMMFGNNARFFNSGGAAGGDTVPAMLTPGEFVMSKNAVSKYGTGFMQKLNRGKIQGYNRGGPVQYRQTGGIMDMLGGAAQSLGIDTSKIEGVFSGFVDNFSSVFDNILGPFNAVAESLRQMSQSFGNFTMQHNVNVEGMINIGGLNIESLKTELSQYIADMVKGEIDNSTKRERKLFRSN